MTTEKYEETKTWIHRIEIEYAKNGTVVTVLSNNGYEDKYIYLHDSMWQGLDSQEQDIMDAVLQTLAKIKESV